MIKEKLNNGHERFKKIKIILQLSKYIRPYRAHYIAVFLVSGLGTLLSLVPTYMIKPLTDKVFAPSVSVSVAQRSNVLNLLVFLLLLVYIVQVLINSIKEYQKRWLSEKIGADIRNDLYAHLQKLPMKFYAFETAGNIQSRICYDTQYLHYFLVDELMNLFIWIVMCLGIGSILFYLRWKLALLLLMPVPIIVLLSRLFGEKIFFAYRVLYQKMGNMSTLAFRAITGATIIKTNVAEKKELFKFVKASDNVFAKRLQTTKVDLSFSPLKGFIIFLSGILVYWIGGTSVIAKDLTLGELMVFIGYTWQFYAPVESLGRAYSTFQNTVASAERVFKIFNAEPEVQGGHGAVDLHISRGAIKFYKVTFGYEGNKNVLEDISFEVSPGEVIGITGPSGAGKSTMVYLLSRLYEISKGAIYIDGFDVRTIKIKSLRNQIGVVLQETLLFYDTIAENIAYARPETSLGEIIAAAKAAGAHNFIMKLPDAYDTLIGESGAGLSGGERQRIAIARVLLKNPKIIIFDESTSALDLKSETLIRTTIEMLKDKHTIFIISHRLSMLDMADKLFVVQGGRISELGSGDRLKEAEMLISSFT